VAVTFEPKRRLRLPSGDLPEPKVAQSRSWLPFAVVVWVLSVAVGHGILYGWLPWFRARSAVAPTSDTAPVRLRVLNSAPTPPAAAPMGNIAEPAVSQNQDETSLVTDPDRLPACERVADPDLNTDEQVEPLPVDLSRSAFGALLDARAWTKPCRMARSVRVHLCVAVKAGRLVAATATTEPNDASTSRCIIRAVSRLPFEPDSALRKVHVTIDLAPDR
jgi:hypothetical protein